MCVPGTSMCTYVCVIIGAKQLFSSCVAQQINVYMCVRCVLRENIFGILRSIFCAQLCVHVCVTIYDMYVLDVFLYFVFYILFLFFHLPNTNTMHHVISSIFWYWGVKVFCLAIEYDSYQPGCDFEMLILNIQNAIIQITAIINQVK